jgi:hypothetical protein
MVEIKPAPRHEVFTIFMQLVAPVFTAATGKRPSVTYDPIEDCYTGPFIELLERVWEKILIVSDDEKLGIAGPRGNIAVGTAAQRLVGLWTNSRADCDRLCP